MVVYLLMNSVVIDFAKTVLQITILFKIDWFVIVAYFGQIILQLNQDPLKDYLYFNY